MSVDAGRLLWALSLCLDFSARGVGRHHQRVAFISLSIADEMGLGDDMRTLLFMAATVHDIGVREWGEREILQRLEVADPWEHCRRGCDLLREVGFLKPVADTVFSHHDRWAGPNPSGLTGEAIPLPARIIHLADRVDVLLPDGGCVLEHRAGILKQVVSLAGRVLAPELVDVFSRVGERESFWLDLVSGFLSRRLDEMGSGIRIRLDLASLEELAALFARLIDEKSRFTYRHSQRVAALAAEVGSRLGFPPEEVALLRVAGLLHDLGKLSIPDALLDKPARLTPGEALLFRQHPYYTYHILREAGEPERLPQWAAYHHERLDGTGYPFRLTGEKLDLGARTVAVCDVFVAMCEDRP
ncbi:MAG: HD domain-containing phosphohydrolase, partial [Bacillota bacterium]